MTHALMLSIITVSYLLWRHVGLTKKSFARLFHSTKMDRNDKIVLKLIKMFIEEGDRF